MELLKLLDDFILLFERLGLPYAVMGGMVVRVYGIPRATYDLDFTVAIPRDRLSEFYAAAEEGGYTVPPEYLSGWVDQIAGMPLVHVRLFIGEKSIDVDIFLAETEFQNEILNRRRRELVNGAEAWIISPEDLILLKLVAYRPRDQGDIGDVMLMQGQLDQAYMRRWADELGVTDRLEKLLTDFAW